MSAKSRTYLFLLVGALLLGFLGCSDKGSANEASSKASTRASTKLVVQGEAASSTNESSQALSFPGATPEEFAQMKACFKAIDDGHDAFAVRHAREFMGSTNVEVRLQAVEAFGWIGKHAVRELAEMMVDPDETVASEALRRWEMAFDEYSSEAAKMWEIERTASLLKDQDKLEAVMMKLSDLEDYNAVKVLSVIISSTNATPVAAEVARAEYASLTGEPFADEKRANQLVTILKNHAEMGTSEPQQPQQSNDKTKKGTK